MKLKEVTVLQGFTNRQEAIQFKNLLAGDMVLVSVVNASGMPVTPICYFVASQSLIDSIQEELSSTDED